MAEPRSESAGAGRYTLLKAVVASTVGTTIEWYDFFLYGTAAGLVFPKVFFPTSDPFSALLFSFGTFGVAFLARPLGAVIFGVFEAAGFRLGSSGVPSQLVQMLPYLVVVISLTLVAVRRELRVRERARAAAA